MLLNCFDLQPPPTDCCRCLVCCLTVLTSSTRAMLWLSGSTWSARRTMPTHSQTTGWPCALSGWLKCGHATVLNILQILQFFTLIHTCMCLKKLHPAYALCSNTGRTAHPVECTHPHLFPHTYVGTSRPCTPRSRCHCMPASSSWAW